MTDQRPGPPAPAGGLPAQASSGDLLTDSVAAGGSGHAWVWDALSVLGVWAAGAAVFFRGVWTSGFTTTMGDVGDTRLIVYLNEHWYRVLHGQDSWLNPAIFYPTKGVLGWSDTFFIYQVFYAPLRQVGFNPFVALQLTVIGLSLVGLVSVVALMRTAFGVSRPVSLALGSVFAFSSLLYGHAGTFQLNGIMLVPAVALAGLIAWRSYGQGQRVKGSLLGAVTGVGAALLLYSTFYVSYFGLMALAFLGLILLVGARRRSLTRILGVLRSHGAPIAVAAASFAAGLVPFLRTYLPARGVSTNSYSNIIHYYAATKVDLVNVGAGNLVWGSLTGHVFPSLRRSSGELQFAVTPILMAAALLGGLLCGVALVRGRAQRPNVARVAAALTVDGVVLTLLPVRTSVGSLWALIYHLPGASSIRAIDRIEIVTQLVAVLAVAAASAELAQHWKGRRGSVGRIAGAVLLCLVLVEQINTRPATGLNVPAQEALLRSVPRPPAPCRSFFATRPYIPPSTHGIPFQLDAMLIAQRVGLPTLNGYTGYHPQGWFGAPGGSPPYVTRVAQWATRHSITEGFCQLDLATMSWSASG